MITPSRRLQRLPQYVIAELAAMKRALAAQGADVIDLSVGDADFAPPGPAVRALREAVEDPAMSRYPFQTGLKEFRVAASNYMARRFGTTFDPSTEILPLIGSKEGLAHLAAAFVNPQDVCVLPDPGYPAYVGGAVLADADIKMVTLQASKGFLLEVGDLPVERLSRTALVYLNYPNNPTAAVAPPEYLERTVETCRRHDIVLAFDNPYCEITFDGYRAPSIFEIDGAREVAVEFHSLSKSFSMTGWRIGWAVGNAELIAALSKMKSWVDTGVFLAVQRAAAAALDQAEALVEPVRAQIEQRRDALIDALRSLGFPVERPRATMYVWCRLPEGIEAMTFAKTVLERAQVVVLPGTTFGQGGEGYFRMALTVGEDRLREAASRLGRVLESLGVVGADA